MEFKFRPDEKVPVIVPEENEEEVWKQSISFPRYEISSFGRVRRAKDGYIMKQRTTKQGYKEIQLMAKTGVRKFPRVHTLVAELFCEPCKENPDGLEIVIDHKDQCSYNNYYKNLRYVTKRENFYNTDIKKRNNIDRKKVPVALVDRDTNEIIAKFANINEASRITKLNADNISYVIHGSRKPFKIGYFIILEDEKI